MRGTQTDHGREAPGRKPATRRFEAVRQAFLAAPPRDEEVRIELYVAPWSKKSLGERIGEPSIACAPLCDYAIRRYSGVESVRGLIEVEILRPYVGRRYCEVWSWKRWLARFEGREIYRLTSQGELVVVDLSHQRIAELGVTFEGLADTGGADTSRDADAWEVIRSIVDRYPAVAALRLRAPENSNLTDLAIRERAILAGDVHLERVGALLDHLPAGLRKGGPEPTR